MSDTGQGQALRDGSCGPEGGRRLRQSGGLGAAVRRQDSKRASLKEEGQRTAEKDNEEQGEQPVVSPLPLPFFSCPRLWKKRPLGGLQGNPSVLRGEQVLPRSSVDWRRGRRVCR